MEIPARYRDQVLARMAGVVIRRRPVQVRLAIPGADSGPERARAGASRQRPRG